MKERIVLRDELEILILHHQMTLMMKVTKKETETGVMKMVEKMRTEMEMRRKDQQFKRDPN